MCEYVKDNICTISKEICPFVYFCNKAKTWRPLKSMSGNCKVKLQAEVPKGYYRVRQARKGYLYVDIDNVTHNILNPFDDVPLFVKATKLKNGSWRLRK